MPDAAIPIRVPRVNANDESVILVRWLADPGQWVRSGSDLYVVETSKSAMGIQAPADGFFHPQAEAGREVRVTQVIGHLLPTADSHVPASEEPASAADPIRITKPAEALARRLGIDPATMTSRGIIREKDVRDHHRSLQKVSSRPEERSGGEVRPELLERIARDREAFGRLSSEFKVWLYRQNGALVGERVTLGSGTVLEAQRIVIGDDTALATGVQVRCREFVIGRLGEIGDNTKVLCGGFYVGDAVSIRFRVAFVDSGAARDCRIGDNCLIGYDSYLNTEMDVTIGRHVCVAPGVRIYTHRKWLSPLQGYSVGLAPVVIGDDSHLGSGVVVLPGVTVGERVTVMANSVLAADTGDERLLAGIPAQPVGSQLAYRRTPDDGEKRRIIVKALQGCMESLAHSGVKVSNPSEEDGGFTAELSQHADSLQVFFRPRLEGWTPPAGRCCLFSFDAEALSLASRDVTVFDLDHQRVCGRRDPLADLLRSHLTNQGLDFEPDLWRHGKPGPGNPDRFDFDGPGGAAC